MTDKLPQLTVQAVEHMSYVQFISLLGETNRCPGGKATVRDIIINSFISANSEVLEVGSNTGFTSLEIARTVGCRVVGIEPETAALSVARETLAEDAPQVRERVSFCEGSAYALPFPDDHFDLVVAGGATSFMGDKGRAVGEYHRVTKPWGFLSVTQLCYVREPPAELVHRVSQIIGTEIRPWTSPQWLEVYETGAPFERYLVREHSIEPRSKERVEAFVGEFLQKPHLAKLPETVRAAIAQRWLRTLSTFNENHRYLGYVFALFRKRYLPEESELFAV